MEKNNKRKKILKVAGLVGLFLLVFGLSYALFTVTLNGTKKVKVKTGKLELQLLDSNNNPIYSTGNNNTSSYEINLDNQVPVDDTTGLGTEAFEFKLKNNGSIKASYTIYLDDVALEVGENRLADEYVRYSLTKNGSSDSAQDLTSIGTAPNRKLDEGVLDTQDVNTYTLKIWVKESADNNAMDKVFNATLRVEGTQYVAPPASPYGTKIAEAQLSETVTATYYQPEDTGYNKKSKAKRMSNVRKIDNAETYDGGTLVISGTGTIPYSYDIQCFLADIESASNFTGVFKYNPTSIIIEEGITSIGKESFSYITSVVNLTIPDTVTKIGQSAFGACSALQIINLPSSVTNIDSNVFFGIASNSTIYCETQEVANLLNSSNYNSSLTTIVVDPTKFN